MVAWPSYSCRFLANTVELTERKAVSVIVFRVQMWDRLSLSAPP